MWLKILPNATKNLATKNLGRKLQSMPLDSGENIQGRVDLFSGVVKMGAEAKPETVIACFAQGSGDTGPIQGGEESRRISSMKARRDNAAAERFVNSWGEEFKTEGIQARFKLITPFQDEC
jgi:hypothetical protein